MRFGRTQCGLPTQVSGRVKKTSGPVHRPRLSKHRNLQPKLFQVALELLSVRSSFEQIHHQRHCNAEHTLNKPKGNARSGRRSSGKAIDGSPGHEEAERYARDFADELTYEFGIAEQEWKAIARKYDLSVRTRLFSGIAGTRAVAAHRRARRARKKHRIRPETRSGEPRTPWSAASRFVLGQLIRVVQNLTPFTAHVGKRVPVSGRVSPSCGR